MKPYSKYLLYVWNLDDFLFSNDFSIIKSQKTIKVVRWLVLQSKFNFCTSYKLDINLHILRNSINSTTKNEGNEEKVERVFCYQNCSDLLWENIVLVIENKILRSLEHFTQTVKGQNNFWLQNALLTCSWRFLISNKLEQLEFNLEKNIRI